MKTKAALIIHNDMDSGTLDSFIVPIEKFGVDLPSLEDMEGINNTYYGEEYAPDMEEIAVAFYTEDTDAWQEIRVDGTKIPEEYEITRIFNMGYTG